MNEESVKMKKTVTFDARFQNVVEYNNMKTLYIGWTDIFTKHMSLTITNKTAQVALPQAAVSSAVSIKHLQSRSSLAY